MRSFVTAIAFVLCVLSSTVCWSYGSQIELGPMDIQPGQEVTIDLANLPIYSGIDYKFVCNLKPVKEDTHMQFRVISGTVQIWVGDCIGSGGRDIVCPIMEGEVLYFGFDLNDKTDGVISLRNLDFRQVFTARCIGKVSENARGAF